MKNELQKLKGFGEEITDYKFNGLLDWFITINDPREIWNAEPTYFLSEWVFITVGVLTFIHSQRVGGRFRWLWLATILHGLFLENVTFWVPEINNFWHSQTTIVLLGRRLPLHIILLYPTFIYSASVAVSRLRLGKISQCLAVGICAVLIDIPYDIMAVKFVHWTWHDTDPNIYDRHYWVPWTSYYFHATFAASFTFAFQFWRRRLCNNDPENQWVSDKRSTRELLCTVLTAFSGMPGGVLQFLPIYHPLHDVFGIHTENCVITLVLIFFLTAWKVDRTPPPGARLAPGEKNGFNEICFGLILHYSLYLGMAIFADPTKEIAIGLHETIGPCDQWTEQKTMWTLISGEVNKRRKYLCLSDYDEKYYDFSCLDKPPKQYSEWYTICGTPFENRAEYIQVIALICFVAFTFFRTMLFKSGPEWKTTPTSKKEQAKLKKK